MQNLDNVSEKCKDEHYPWRAVCFLRFKPDIPPVKKKERSPPGVQRQRQKRRGWGLRPTCPESEKVLTAFQAAILCCQHMWEIGWGHKGGKMGSVLPNPQPSTSSKVEEPLSLLQPKDKTNICPKMITKPAIKSQHIYVQCSIIYNRQNVEAAQVSIDGWMAKQNVVYTYNESYPALKRKEILTHTATWMNLEDIMLRKISQSQKDKSCMIPLIWGA